jgi:hypothetical protein
VRRRSDSSDRRLPDAARAKIADFVQFSSTWGRIYLEFAEDRWRDWENLIGLTQPNREFRDGIATAIFLAMCLHQAPPKRASIVRRELRAIARHAANAATALQWLGKAFAQALPLPLSGEEPREPLATLLAPATLDCLREWAQIAGHAANRVPVDTGGPAKKLVAFYIFIRVLADAFGRATGNRATVSWNEYRDPACYEGRFFKLVELLLRMVTPIVGDGFAPSSALARGKAIQRNLALMDITSATPP